MKFVKFALMACGALAAVLALSVGVMQAGIHGVIVLAGCLLPVALGGLTLVQHKGMPRWGSIISLLGLLIVGMKTSEAEVLGNVMMLAVAGMLCALALAIRPDRPS